MVTHSDRNLAFVMGVVFYTNLTTTPTMPEKENMSSTTQALEHGTLIGVDTLGIYSLSS